MKTFARTLAVTLAALLLSLGSAPADAARQGHWGGHSSHGHGGHHGHGWFWGGFGTGIGLGYYGPWYPGYVVVEPPSAAYYGRSQTRASPLQPPCRTLSSIRATARVLNRSRQTARVATAGPPRSPTRWQMPACFIVPPSRAWRVGATR
jgi:hypothetical protein